MAQERKISVLICDDDPVMLERLRALCAGALAGRQAEIFAATEYGALPDGGRRCDIAVLDIQMPIEDGIALSRRICEGSPRCQILFVSGFVRYVSEVYEVPHLCLVMKDQLDSQLPRFLNRAVARLLQDEQNALTVHSRGRTVTLLPSEISYMERTGHVSSIKLQTGETLSTYEKLDQLLERADRRLLCRCHVSYAVYLGAVRAWDKSCFRLKDGTEIPISRVNEREAKKRFFDYLGDAVGR